MISDLYPQMEECARRYLKEGRTADEMREIADNSEDSGLPISAAYERLIATIIDKLQDPAIEQ